MKKFGLVLVAVVVATVALGTKPVSADVNDFTVTEFHSDQTLSRADPQGQLHIVEQINVKFTDNNHGLLRAIPKSYKHHDLKLHVNSIRSDTGAPTDYKIDSSNGNTVLKIGNPSRTVTGVQQYTIDYTLNNVISFYSDHSELYWDVNGTDWRQPLYLVSVSLHLPPGLQQTRAPVCYTGAYGDNQAKCVVFTTKQQDKIVAVTTAPLQAGQGLTYVASFAPGYFVPAKWYDPSGEYFRRLLEFLAPIVIVSGLSAAIWWRRGRDPKGSGVIVPRYQPPSGLNPASVGVIYNFELSNRDITATIVQLALRGYLKIIETKKIRKLRKDTVSYQLQLISADINRLDTNEQLLITALFDTLNVGQTIDINAKKEKLYNTAKKLSKNISLSLTKDGYFRSNPINAGPGLAFTSWIMIWIVCFHFLGIWYFAMGALISGLIALWFGRAMGARTVKGVAAKEQISGLKMYLEVAEKDRIQKLQSPDAPYADMSKQPVKTVELFEKLLPYAIVLGVEKQWAGKFEGLYDQPPGWYTGSWNTFSAGYLASSLTDGVGGAIDTAFSQPSSSNSSGFGGGFSGGGGGGGGGGGW